MASAESGGLLRGAPVRFCNEPFVEFAATARAEAGAVFDHAGGDPADVRDFGAVQAECVARTLWLRFSGECKARARQRGQGDCDRNMQVTSTE
jgi:hypothetical protein